MEHTIYGTHAVLAFLTNTPKKAEKLFIKETKGNAQIDEMKALAAKAKVPVSFVDHKALDKMTEGAVHQGVVLAVKEFDYTELSTFLKHIDIYTNPSVLVLDEIEDPHNMGAIIRTATALGASGIIVPKHRSAPIGGTVYKTSAGTVGKIPIIRVTNINQALEELKKKHFWAVSFSGEATESIFDIDMKSATALIIGNEGRGVSSYTEKLADFTCHIPMSNNVESLNASISASLALYEWKRQNS